MLYIVATPIGNLKDITLRALKTLQAADGIICEDTRRTSLLLSHYQIHKPLTVLNDYNEYKMFPRIINLLKQGQNLALVSDAGTPLVADPGFKLVRECIKEGIQVDSLPGPSSILPALTLSGLPPDKFMFLGYPPEKSGQRINWLKSLRLHLKGVKLNFTIIMFAAPHKLIRILEDMKEVLGDIEVTLAHELTKIHQSVETKTVSDWLETLKNPKGEYILLFRYAA